MREIQCQVILKYRDIIFDYYIEKKSGKELSCVKTAFDFIRNRFFWNFWQNYPKNDQLYLLISIINFKIYFKS